MSDEYELYTMCELCIDGSVKWMDDRRMFGWLDGWIKSS